jgi:hypothetical protein
MTVKQFSLLFPFVLVWAMACSQSTKEFGIVRTLEHRDRTLHNAYFRGYAYVTVSNEADSASMKVIASKVQESVMRQANKKAFLWLQIIYLNYERTERTAIYDMRLSGNSQKVQGKFIYYRGKYIHSDGLDKRIKQSVRSEQLKLPANILGIWDGGGHAEFFYTRGNHNERLTYIGGMHVISANKRPGLKSFKYDGRTIYRGFFESESVDLDSTDFVINEYGDLEQYALYPHFQYLYPKMDIQKIMANDAEDSVRITKFEATPESFGFTLSMSSAWKMVSYEDLKTHNVRAIDDLLSPDIVARRKYILKNETNIKAMPSVTFEIDRPGRVQAESLFENRIMFAEYTFDGRQIYTKEGEPVTEKLMQTLTLPRGHSAYDTYHRIVFSVDNYPDKGKEMIRLTAMYTESDYLASVKFNCEKESVHLYLETFLHETIITSGFLRSKDKTQ